jgi:large subunit ribosomal protein L13
MNMTIYIDAEDQIAGRMASHIVKLLLKGEHVYVLNAEKAVISGGPEHIVHSFKEKVDRGDPYHGPFYPRNPERILKRIIRGMIPYKKATGKEAYKRLKVFVSVPEEFGGKEMKKFDDSMNAHKYKFISIGQLSKSLGGKV